MFGRVLVVVDGEEKMKRMRRDQQPSLNPYISLFFSQVFCMGPFV